MTLSARYVNNFVALHASCVRNFAYIATMSEIDNLQREGSADSVGVREAPPRRVGSPLDYVREGRRNAAAKHRVLSARELEQKAVDYFEYMRGRMWTKVEVVKSGALAGMRFDVPTQSPLTISGFLLFAGLSRHRWGQYEASECLDTREVTEWVAMMIETQNFEGAAVGAFNANLIARKLKLSERAEVEHSGSVEQIVGLVVK